MKPQNAPRLERIFRSIVALRWWIVAVHILLCAAGVHFTLEVGSDNSIDRLIVESDPDYRATREFQRIFPEGERVILLAEAADPLAADVLAKVDELEGQLRGIRRVKPISALSLYRRLRPDFEVTPEKIEAFRRFATGTDLLRRQALIGDGFLGIPLELDVGNAAERDRTLEAIDRALARSETGPSPLLGVRKVGGAYVDAYLEAETRRASLKYFGLFGLFVVVVNLALYRSMRTLAAFLVTLAVSVELTVAFAGVAGFSFTIVSSLVPLIILVTCTSTLVYLHSRFVVHPAGVAMDDHHAFALSNKFPACTASIFAAAVGFAALAVSKIRPIRELGLWVAAGLVLTWVVVFTLFPALQRILATPTQQHHQVAGGWFPPLVASLPMFTYRARFILVSLALSLSLAGGVALLGFPGLLEPMRLETDALAYIDPHLPLYRDTKRFEGAISGLTVTEAWIRTPEGAVLDPEVLRGLERFSRILESDSRVASVVGPTTILRFMRYANGQDDRLPQSASEWTGLAGDLEQLLLLEPDLRGFVDVGSLANTHLTLISRGSGYTDLQELSATIREVWLRVVARDPALGACTMKVVGQGLLQAKISHYLVPTLAQSFALTAAIIFVTFLLVFRSGAARLMAMIPSLFAILVMFLVMRVARIPLNVATILIASTVLGASENDQIHFFYHFQERRRDGSTEQSLRHTLLIAGRAILFATLINAGGFLALALSDLPPMRQFGIISASAFILSMIADFTALPAALWIFFRDKPDSLKKTTE